MCVCVCVCARVLAHEVHSIYKGNLLLGKKTICILCIVRI